MSIYYRNLLVSILLGFPGHTEYLYMLFDILFGTWDNILSAVGVDHLGSTQSGGSAFYSYHWDPSETPWLEHSLLAFTFLPIMDHWCMVISLLMDVISLLMYGCIMYVRWFHLLILLISWIRRGWCISYFHMYILLSLSYPVTCTVDDWVFRISFAKRCSEQMYNMDIGLSNYSFMWMLWLLDLVLIKFKCDSMS